MKTIEIIDLICMIYNGDEELPEKLIWNNGVYRLFKDDSKIEYITDDGKLLFTEILDKRHMNDFVKTELFKEEDKGIEKIENLEFRNFNEYENLEIRRLKDTINQLIDVVNELNKKEGK